MATGDADLALIGVFRLLTPNREEVRLPSKKSRAILAMLALAKDGVRSRNWLQSKLWSRSARTEAQANLRRELTVLRAVLAACQLDILEIRRDQLRLRLDRCKVDVLEPHADTSALLEGLDIPDEPEFAAWLRAARSAPTAHFPPDPPPRDRARPDHGEPYTDGRLLLAVSVDTLGGELDIWVTHFAQCIIEHANESGVIRVTLPGVGVSRETPDAILSAIIGRDDQIVHVAVQLAAPLGEVLFATSKRIASPPGSSNTIALALEELTVIAVANVLRAAIDRKICAEGRHYVYRLLAAISGMFSLDVKRVRASRQELHQLRSAALPAGLVNAWLAFYGVWEEDFLDNVDRGPAHIETHTIVRTALTENPSNPLILSLGAYVHAFVLGDLTTSEDLIERAEFVGARGIFYFIAKSQIECARGRLDEALKSALLAERFGRSTSFRYLNLNALCIIESLRGNLDAAISFGFRSLDSEPVGATSHLPSTLRFLAAALAHDGAIAQARDIVNQLDPQRRDALYAPCKALSFDAVRFLEQGFRLL